MFRFNIFAESYKTIELHNSNEKATYKMGLNQFADISDEEFE